MRSESGFGGGQWIYPFYIGDSNVSCTLFLHSVPLRRRFESAHGYAGMLVKSIVALCNTSHGMPVKSIVALCNTSRCPFRWEPSS